MMNQLLSHDLIIRRERLQKLMQEKGVDACVLATSVNIFYMTGCVYNGYFYLPAQGEPIHFVKRPESIPFDRTIYINKPELVPSELEKLGMPLPQTVMLEVDTLPMSHYIRLEKALGVTKVENASVQLRYLRSIKTAFELDQTRACAGRHEAVYRLVPSLYRRGMTDIEFQIEIERTMRIHGSLGIFRSYGENMDIYMGSLLAGDNAEAASPFDFALGGAGVDAMLPLGASGQVIKEGQTIMVDMAGNYSPWMTDMTRVFSVGKTSDLAYKAHDVSCQIQEAVISISRPGASCADMYHIALDLAKKNKLEEYFMGTKQQAKFVGHGVGLEINEPPVLTPRSREVLEENVVFALEPKFVIPNVGAVGIENTFVVTSTGLEKLTNVEESIIEL